MPDRTKAPHTSKIEAIHFEAPEHYLLDNGIPVYAINLGTQPVLKLEVVFQAGRPYEHKYLVARTTAALLKEGSRRHSSAEIAETIDFYGGTLSVPVNLDTSNIVLYCLERHFRRLLPLVAELLTSPAFPKNELTAFQDRNVKRLEVDLQRNDVVAYRQITEEIFGPEHVYGYNSTAELYRGVSLDDLHQHFESHFHAGNCAIFISGRLGMDTRELLNEYLGRLIPPGQPSRSLVQPISTKPVRQRIPFDGAVQSAIRIGRPLFNRQHPDYNAWYVLNTILGGYFGSRLMNNIREEKGYTYNIFSAIDTMLFDGYFYIGTEVSTDLTEATIREIYQEIELLQTEEVEDDELEMVQNYLMGTLLTMVDGPFNVAELIRTLVTENLPLNAFNELVYTIQHITSKELQELAQRYLNKEDMWEVIVG